MVAAETRGEWPKAFFLNENINRATTPMEEHSGPIFYHAAALLVLFAPWSIFIGATFWYGVKASRIGAELRAHRFLLCWFGAYLLLFSLVKTKLPNYVLPLYPALAILTARFLTRWLEGELAIRRWIMPAAVGGMLFVAVGAGGGLLAAGGAFDIPTMRTSPAWNRGPPSA